MPHPLPFWRFQCLKTSCRLGLSGTTSGIGTATPSAALRDCFTDPELSHLEAPARRSYGGYDCATARSSCFKYLLSSA